MHCLFRPDPDRPGTGEFVFWCEDGDAEEALKRWVGGGLPRLEEREIDVIVPLPAPEPVKRTVTRRIRKQPPPEAPEPIDLDDDDDDDDEGDGDDEGDDAGGKTPKKKTAKKKAAKRSAKKKAAKKKTPLRKSGKKKSANMVAKKKAAPKAAKKAAPKAAKKTAKKAAKKAAKKSAKKKVAKQPAPPEYEEIEEIIEVIPDVPRWTVETVTAKALGILPGISLLSRVESTPDPMMRMVVPSDSIIAWSHAAKFALELVAAGRFLPSLEEGDEAGEYLATWSVVLGRNEDRDRFRRLAFALPPCAFAWPQDDEDEEEDDDAAAELSEFDDSDDLLDPDDMPRRPPPPAPARDDDDDDDEPKFIDPRTVLRDFLDAAADTLFRLAATQSAARLRATPKDAPPWAARWLQALSGADPRFRPEGLQERHLPDELWAWSVHALGAGGDTPFRVLFDLQAPPDDAPEDATWRLEYQLQSADDPSQLLPIAAIWSVKDARATLFGKSVREPHDTVLRALGEAARVFPPIESSLRRPRPTHVNLRAGGAWLFIHNSAPLLQLMGHGVHIPPDLDAGGQRRLHARLQVSGKLHTDETAGTADAVIDWTSPARFKWQVVLDGLMLSPREFKELVKTKRALARWNDRWVCIDPADLATLTKVVHGGPRGEGSLAEALALALRGTAPLGPDLPEVPVVALGEMNELVTALRDRGTPEMPEPAGFHGELRPYQARGLGWLSDMHTHGLGGILADDMGLGKTIQLLALLQAVKEASDPSKPSILICPTSVLGNWGREAERFVPDLPVVRHHGPERAKTVAEFHERVPAGALVLTTYAIARLDEGLLSRIDWACAVLDEAQNIKNPQAAQSMAVREFRAPRRFALTGTPVENRLADLWSILDWANPGLLGPLEQFRRVVARPIERYRDPRAAGRLRRLVSPFVLRRLKSDPEIAPDLPDKVDHTVACSLSKEQVRLYRKAVTDAWKDIQGKSGIKRRGKVLALLTALKQICNHPAHFLKKDKAPTAQSGKLQRLSQMIEEAMSAGDRALIFTQYVEMGHLLVQHLEKAFGWEVPFLHGGVPARKRDEQVARFQESPDAPPVFLLSLKAGGTGLNLTRANHVFHYDQWWNPAVEDQATDRAHRIGQTRTVYVHRLVSIGTLEEKIARMLDDKRGLAEIAIGQGEHWLTELGDEELRALVDLSADAVVSETGG
ncbi:MAG: DEAD/DEAH box helicase [Planctomycetota bacterium]